jgi:hypothetical protein
MAEEAYPLAWPIGRRRTRLPKGSPFKVLFPKARDELMREIALLGGSLPVLSTNIPLRRDGLPYAGQKEPDDRGVAVYFVLKNQQMCFACDCWDKVGDNVQAIRHTIAALRGIERWGTGDMVQQAFAGFIALPSPKDANGVARAHRPVSPEESPYSVLGVKPSATPEEIEAAYRRRIKLAHPDVGGSAEAVQRLNDARRQIKGSMA